MEIIPGVADLEYTITFSAVSVYADWVTNTRYYRGARVEDITDGKIYEMRWYSYQSSTQPNARNHPTSGSYPWFEVASSAVFEVDTISTNAILSVEDAWAPSVDIAGLERVSGSDVFHDYEARLDIDSSDNTLTPYASLGSEDQLISERWLDLGLSNAAQVLDSESDTRLVYDYEDAGTYLWVEVTVQNSESSNRLCIAGMRNVSDIHITLDGGTEYEFDLEYGTSTGVYRTNYIYEHAADTGVLYRIEFYPADSSEPIEVGLIHAGTAIDLGCTQADIEVGVNDYSTTERDQYGNINYVQRGQASNFRARVLMDSADADYVSRVVNLYGRSPTFWNFNNSDTSFDRLIIHGWAEKVSTTIGAAASKEDLIMDMQEVVK